jgi:hypothetical protein
MFQQGKSDAVRGHGFPLSRERRARVPGDIYSHVGAADLRSDRLMAFLSGLRSLTRGDRE